MARGWESKNVEEQMAQAATKAAPEREGRPSTEELELQRKRRGLELALSRIHSDLTNCTNERHRAMLETAKADLERQIREL